MESSHVLADSFGANKNRCRVSRRKDGEGRYWWWTGEKHVWGIRGLVWRWGWDVESPHILADSFRANKNGCRISRRKDGECGGGEEAGTRGLKEGEMARREWDKIESGAVQKGTGKGSRGKWR